MKSMLSKIMAALARALPCTTLSIRKKNILRVQALFYSCCYPSLSIYSMLSLFCKLLSITEFFEKAAVRWLLVFIPTYLLILKLFLWYRQYLLSVQERDSGAIIQC